MIEERHNSPDGKLTLVVEQLADSDDFIIGFEGFPWHTHPDLLGGYYKLQDEVTVRRFIDDVLEDRLVVVVERLEGVIADVSVSFDPFSEGGDLPAGVTIELRRWNDR